MLVLDYLATQLGLAWNKNKDWPAYVTGTTIYADPPKVKNKKTNIHSDNLEKDKVNQELLKNDDSGVEDSNSLITTSASTRLPLTPSLLSTNSRRIKPDPTPLEITLMKPLLLMNISGKSVSKAVKELGISPSNVIIIHDDMQREIGKISMKSGGSAK
ncbi:3036_t:CDS:2 [Acaulospora colombiana]|uniref:3036_t:CDS:1 n=1 Tax=Acaulospora colombiana TaxID=27376 RepID=A0ACA9M434_9GLOM|nr:3036_t:CDS:2 [Acaulospora colombiana]